jgi:DNA replication protein DnaC
MPLICDFSLDYILKDIGLLTILKSYQKLAIDMEKDEKSFVDYLTELLKLEQIDRNQKRIERLLKNAKLPRSKILKDFDISKIPSLSRAQIQSFAKGDFIDRIENLLIFGNPGTGKTHLSIALAREWCLQNEKVFYVTAASLVQQLLKAKRDLMLEQMIKKLDGFEVLVIDDFSYIPFDKSETDVLFTLLSARYEMRSVVITSNLSFSNWGQIFKDEMTTTACIDRLVHHATILELNTESYRMKQAKNRLISSVHK